MPTANERRAALLVTWRFSGPLLAVLSGLLVELGQMNEASVWNASCATAYPPSLSWLFVAAAAAALILPALCLKSPPARLLCTFLQLAFAIGAASYLVATQRLQPDDGFECYTGGHANAPGEGVFIIAFGWISVVAIQCLVLALDWSIVLARTITKRSRT